MYTMSRFMLQWVTKQGLSLRNNEQQNLYQALLKMF